MIPKLKFLMESFYKSMGNYQKYLDADNGTFFIDPDPQHKINNPEVIETTAQYPALKELDLGELAKTFSMIQDNQLTPILSYLEVFKKSQKSEQENADCFDTWIKYITTEVSPALKETNKILKQAYYNKTPFEKINEAYSLQVRIVCNAAKEMEANFKFDPTNSNSINVEPYNSKKV